MEVGVKIRKLLVNYLFGLAFLLMIGTIAFADTTRLKDGSVLKGKVVSYRQGKFTIIVYIGGTTSRHEVSVEEVESVEFDASDPTASAQTSSTGGSLVPVDPGVARNEPVESRPPADPSTESPTTKPPVGAPPANDLPPAEAGAATAAVIAEKTVSVAAAADWTSTEIRVQRGQRVLISVSGEVELGAGRRSGPDGVPVADNRKLIPNRPTGSLIAVVGDDNDDFIYVGSTGEFAAPHNGILFLSVNEGNLKDNNGAFLARVKVMSGK
jgi:hypothetical protein